MTKTEVYELIVRLTADIKWSGYAKKLFEAAKQEKITEFNQLYKGFMEEYQDVYQQIIWFGDEFNRTIEASENKNIYEIFGSKRNRKRNIFVFDSDRIDVLSFLMFIIYSKIDDAYLFERNTRFNVSTQLIVDELYNLGYAHIAEFIVGFCFTDLVGDDEDQYCSIYELLTTIGRGVFEDSYNC